MTTTSTQYENASRPLLAVLEAVPRDGWDNASPCAGWSARDVLAHVIETQRDFLAGRGIELGPAPDVAADPVAAWRDHAERVTAVISDDRVVDTGYDGFFGPTTVGATFDQAYVWDMLVHRWDIARSVGADARLSDAELDRIEAGADSFGEALYMEGICRRGVEPPEDAGRAARVLARLGRSA
ncbi:TIGR03086 family metal-binding protein [Blastococcus deserti]|uniref:TIGR03086 family metal-binding protein n=1 Tax=Blastococcus deserti TaxID=2259033 RepID=A0ABW4X7R3_9ACTN